MRRSTSAENIKKNIKEKEIPVNVSIKIYLRIWASCKIEHWRDNLLEMSNMLSPERRFRVPVDDKLLLSDEITPLCLTCRNCRRINKDWHSSLKGEEVLGWYGHFQAEMQVGLWVIWATQNYTQQYIPVSGLHVPLCNLLPSHWCGQIGVLFVGILQIFAGFKKRKHLHWPDIWDNKSKTQQSIKTM